jgi:hypothetical protein
MINTPPRRLEVVAHGTSGFRSRFPRIARDPDQIPQHALQTNLTAQVVKAATLSYLILPESLATRGTQGRQIWPKLGPVDPIYLATRAPQHDSQGRLPGLAAQTQKPGHKTRSLTSGLGHRSSRATSPSSSRRPPQSGTADAIRQTAPIACRYHL